MAEVFDYTVDDRGIARVTFDTPGKRVNVWSTVTFAAFEELLTELAGRRDLAAVVFLSGKPDSYIAGADIDMLGSVTSAEEAERMSRRGQSAFERLADLSVPTIAAIHGACVGGGLEFALACSFRLATDADVTRLGFPEVQLGIIPAWGGTQRATRLVGVQNALNLILTGRSVSARTAERMGLVDREVPRTRLDSLAQEVALAAIQGREVPAGAGRRRVTTLLLDRNPVGRRVAFSQSRKRVRERSGNHYPAPFRAIDVIETGLSNGHVAGLEAEARAVADLSTTSAARNLMWLYRQQEDARRPIEEGVARPVDRLGLLGAGVMGGGLAEVAAYRGVSVRMKDIDATRVSAGLAHAARIARGLEKRGKFSRRQVRDLMNRISGTTAYTGFGRVDLVVEAIVEDLDIKRSVLAEVEDTIPSDAVMATNTSSLRVDDMATALTRPDRFGGLHFFNPVERMPLVEVVRGRRTSPDTVATLQSFAIALGKTPVIVQDAPGFWVNRLLMPYLNEATHLYAEGVPVEALDGALRDFGLPMGPLELLDEIGLDIAGKVAKVLGKAFPSRMKPSPLLHRLESSGRLGRKSGRGFYKYEKGRRGDPDGELRSELGLAPREEEEQPVLESREVVARCLYPMVNEAAQALAEDVVATPAEGDLALVMGIGWPPFRGGLLRWADEVGLSRIVDRLDEWSAVVDDRLAPDEALREVSRWEGGFYGAPPEPSDDPQQRLGGEF